MKAKLMSRRGRAYELSGDIESAIEWTEKSLLENSDDKVK